MYPNLVNDELDALQEQLHEDSLTVEPGAAAELTRVNLGFIDESQRRTSESVEIGVGEAQRRTSEGVQIGVGEVQRRTSQGVEIGVGDAPNPNPDPNRNRNPNPNP